MVENNLEEDQPSITLKVNENCTNDTAYDVTVSFGVRENDTTGCDPKQCQSAAIFPGNQIKFNATLELKQNHEYCFNDSLKKDPSKFVTWETQHLIRVKPP